MNNMYGVFNAPSRYAIFKRIMERSGDSWSWQKFVEYDVINRSADAAEPQYGFTPNWDEMPRPAPPVSVPLEDVMAYL